MRQTKLIMGMPITIDILDSPKDNKIFKKVFDYFRYVDKTFSTYKKTSEISGINRGEIKESEYSRDMQDILIFSRKTKKDTNGYFDIYRNGFCDPSGIVKGWAIFNVSKIIKKLGFRNFYIDCGGDIQVGGKNRGKNWTVGIKNPFDQNQIVKAISIYNKGVATSGTYIRGNHIYNPKDSKSLISDTVCITVIGPNIYEADRFATAAFAMGANGIYFMEKLKNFEAYAIDKKGIATATSGFEKYVFNNY